MFILQEDVALRLQIYTIFPKKQKNPAGILRFVPDLWI